VAAARDGTSIILVGDRDKIAAALARRGVDLSGIPLTIHHASEVITMDDTPSKVVRTRTDASMLVCFDLVKQGKAQAVVSAGNSGAMLACGLLKFGRLKGIDRPAIGASVPRWRGQCVLLDMGANVECKPINLVQFAVLGAVFDRTSNGTPRPRVGVLSNGSARREGHRPDPRGPPGPHRPPEPRLQLHRLRRGQGHLRRGRRRRRHRRVHRQRGPQGARGDRGDDRPAPARRDRRGRRAHQGRRPADAPDLRAVQGAHRPRQPRRRAAARGRRRDDHQPRRRQPEGPAQRAPLAGEYAAAT
jgi:hypothetical protein